MKTGYSIRTWRMRLVCPEPIWLDRTEEYFQNVVEFYYHLLRQHEELWNSSLFDIQRSLELLTLAGRDGRQPTNPLPMGKVPVYLRRAAINKASATVKSTQELQSGFPEKLEAKVTFFKGMYSDLTDRSICLKLWNGEKWIWTDCNLKGRPFPQDGQLMSPTLVKEGRRYLLNIPVKQENSDARTAKERMAEGTNLCSVRFTNTDTFAVCCILDLQNVEWDTENCLEIANLEYTIKMSSLLRDLWDSNSDMKYKKNTSSKIVNINNGMINSTTIIIQNRILWELCKKKCWILSRIYCRLLKVLSKRRRSSSENRLFEKKNSV